MSFLLMVYESHNHTIIGVLYMASKVVSKKLSFQFQFCLTLAW